MTLNKVFLLPSPKVVRNSKGSFSWNPFVLDIHYLASDDIKSELFHLKQGLEKTFLQINFCPSHDLVTNGLRIVLKKIKNAYEIKIDKNGVLLVGKDGTGVFHGIQTLLQMFQSCQMNWPCGLIQDSPKFELRGFYHDVTRSKVPTLDTLKLLVDRMAYYKLNHLQLYIEHTFAYRNIPEVWVGKDPLTAAEILELDEYAAKRHVELVPSFSTFGHMYEMMRVKKLQHLNELDITALDEPYSFRHRMAHYTLDVSQKGSEDLIKEIIDEVIPLFRSKKFNICCDETFDLGKGKNAKKAEKSSSTALYVNFLKKIMNHVKKRNKQVMFWGDIILKEPKLIKDLPKDVICLNWNYSANPLESASKTFSQNKVTQVMCPGTSGWNTFVNRVAISSSNIQNMTKYAEKYKALGILNTDWGDYGHVNTLALSKYGLVFGAECSWSGSSVKIEAFEEKFSFLEWGDGKGSVAKLLRQVGDYQFYDFAKMYQWIRHIDSGIEEKVKEISLSTIKKAKTEILKLSNELIQEMVSLAIPEHDLKEILWSLQATLWSLDVLLCKRKFEWKIKEKNDITLAEVIKEGYICLQNLIVVWRLRNRESELSRVQEGFQMVLHGLEDLSIKK